MYFMVLCLFLMSFVHCETIQGESALKRIYQKPDICFDNFEMCTDIAGSSSYITNTPTRGGCGLEYSNTITIFIEGVGACNFKPPVTGGSNTSGVMDGEYNGICYHVPAGTNSLFGS